MPNSFKDNKTNTKTTQLLIYSVGVFEITGLCDSTKTHDAYHISKRRDEEEEDGEGGHQRTVCPRLDYFLGECL